MSFVKFTIFEEEEESSPGDSQFSNIIDEEEYESETEVSAFQGFQKGFSEEVEVQNFPPKPWDPSEPVWALLDDTRSCTKQ